MVLAIDTPVAAPLHSPVERHRAPGRLWLWAPLCALALFALARVGWELCEHRALSSAIAAAQPLDPPRDVHDPIGRALADLNIVLDGRRQRLVAARPSHSAPVPPRRELREALEQSYDEQASRWLEANRDVLAAVSALHRAARDRTGSFDTAFGAFTVVVELHRLTQTEALIYLLNERARMAAARGDAATAVEALHELFWAGSVAHQPIMGGSEWVACQAIARLASRLPLDGASTDPHLRGRVEELIRTVADERIGRQRELWAVRYMRDEWWGGETARRTTLWWLTKPAHLHDRAASWRYFARVEEALDAPTWQSFSAIEVRPPPTTTGLNTVDRISDRSDPSIRVHWQWLYGSRAQRRLAATALAIRLYQLDHDGRRPRSLRDLVPKYLSDVPVDPFAADARPLGYRNDSQVQALYSVGPDGSDETADLHWFRTSVSTFEDDIRIPLAGTLVKDPYVDVASTSGPQPVPK